MKRILRATLALTTAASLLIGCGSDDDGAANADEPGNTGGASAQGDAIDTRCAMSLCPNDATAYTKEDCDVFVQHPCFDAWVEEMNCRRAQEVCDDQGLAVYDSVRSCIENSPLVACTDALGQ